MLVEKGKTGKWLAEQVGKNEATVSRWCSNKMQPSLDMLVKIAGLLNVDPRQLINGGNNDSIIRIGDLVVCRPIDLFWNQAEQIPRLHDALLCTHHA